MDEFQTAEESSFVVDEISNIIKESIESAIGGNAYQHNKVNQWTTNVVEQTLSQLTKLGKPFKYIVTCVIMQKNGAGLHTASSCFWDNATDENDEPPHSNAGQDVVLQLPVDWVILDGRESSDDHAIIRYDWTLLLGDPLVQMKVPQPGTLKLSNLQEGVYNLQLTVTDTSGQKSSDNVSVSVLAEERHGTDCTGTCSRYQFICDDGCCIDITLACDRVIQCPDGSDEAFCQNFNSGRKTVIHISESTDKQTGTGNYFPTEIVRTAERKMSLSLDKGKNYSLTQELHHNMLIQDLFIDTDPSESDKDDEGRDSFLNHKDIPQGSGHPVPETGAILPLALGLAITALLLLMVVCRLQLVKQKLKKARPLTSEESDYLINGMYL
ncbi:hypothetical protein XENTR_v10013931 [Xenopus tropicalis]|nr:hypothetical protein XENTR_v10013931 [Xenopus tropicalis]